MSTASSDNKSPKRPGQSGLLIGVRLQPKHLGALDAWIAAHDSGLSRPEAIRMILAEKLDGANG